MHFQEDNLPSVTFTQLKEPQIDARTRLISDEDKLAQIFYPIYMNERVSLQCLTPQHIVVDGEARYCDPHSLQFGPFPWEIKVDGKTVLAIHIPHIPQHLKLAYMAEDFTSISLFKETNDTGRPFGQDIIGFFETAQPIHYSLFGMSFIVVIVLVILCCCTLYLNCPKLLIRLFCCCSNSCSLKQKVLNRVAGQDRRVENRAHLDNNPGHRRNNYQVNNPRADERLLIDMTLNPTVPIAETSFNQNDQNAGQIGVNMVRDTGARMVHGTPVIRDQAPSAPRYSVADGSGFCRYGYQDCLCASDPSRYPTCMGNPRLMQHLNREKIIGSSKLTKYFFHTFSFKYGIIAMPLF